MIVDVLLLEFVFVGACLTRVEGVKLLDIITPIWVLQGILV